MMEIFVQMSLCLNVFPPIHFKFPYIITAISIKNSIFSNHTSVATNYKTIFMIAFLGTFNITQQVVTSCCGVPNFKIHCVMIVKSVDDHEFYFIDFGESKSNPAI